MEGGTEIGRMALGAQVDEYLALTLLSQAKLQVVYIN